MYSYETPLALDASFWSITWPEPLALCTVQIWCLAKVKLLQLWPCSSVTFRCTDEMIIVHNMTWKEPTEDGSSFLAGRLLAGRQGEQACEESMVAVSLCHGGSFKNNSKPQTGAVYCTATAVNCVSARLPKKFLQRQKAIRFLNASPALGWWQHSKRAHDKGIKNFSMKDKERFMRHLMKIWYLRKTRKTRKSKEIHSTGMQRSQRVRRKHPKTDLYDLCFEFELSY